RVGGAAGGTSALGPSGRPKRLGWRVAISDWVTNRTAGRMKKYDAIRSSAVDRARNRANPRTGPIVSHHNNPAPMSDAMSAARMVRNDVTKDLSVAERIVRPL